MTHRLARWTVFLGLFASPLVAADLSSDPNIFFIKRNKNTNEVHYDARVVDCRWADPAVDGYWRMLEIGPNAYEEIQFYERRAYGFDVRMIDERTIRMTLTPAPESPVTVTLEETGGGCTAKATVSINGESADLSAIYVHAVPGFLSIPTVAYVDVLGRWDGQMVYERRIESKKHADLAQVPPDPSLWTSGAAIMGR